jgi:hypothetical protein
LYKQREHWDDKRIKDKGAGGSWKQYTGRRSMKAKEVERHRWKAMEIRVGSQSRRKGGWQQQAVTGSLACHEVLLSWQHDTQRLKAAAPYNSGQHVAKTTECIQNTRQQTMRTWGCAKNPQL